MTGQQVADLPADKSLAQLIGEQMPAADEVSAAHPCGDGHSIYASKSASASKIDFDTPKPEFTLDVAPGDPLPEGMVGFWTTVLKPTDPNAPADKNCVTDPADCKVVQTVPTSPSIIVGVDLTAPDSYLTAPAEGTKVETNEVKLKIHIGEPIPPLSSGVKSVTCRNEDGPKLACANGELWVLSPSPGNKKITLEVTDMAGNVTAHSVNLKMAADQAPKVEMSFSAATGNDGWYTQPPVATLKQVDNDALPGDPSFYWTLDRSAEKPCAGNDDQCVVELSGLNSGDHIFGFTGVDAFGSRWARSHYMDPKNTTLNKAFKFDGTAPTVNVFVVPPQPNGGSGWYSTRPLVVGTAIDDEGGSGIATTEYTIGGQPWQPYTGPISVPVGKDQFVCVRAFDHAGLQGATCAGPLDVDTEVPFASAHTNGFVEPHPDGDGGWFVTTPAVTFTHVDLVSGLPTDEGRWRYRVDNGPYEPCDAGCQVPAERFDGTGHHEVQWSAVDEAGNRRLERTVAVNIDREAPTTKFEATPWTPEGANGWHVRSPEVRLWAEDQPLGSGVGATYVWVDGGAAHTYEDPIVLGEGEHEVCGWSTDGAGNSETPHCVKLRVDLVDPLAEVKTLPTDGQGNWYLDTTTVSADGADKGDGAGIDVVADTPALCDHLADEDPAPSGLCISIDGRPFVPFTGPLAVGEGRHDARVFSVDGAGRRSPMATGILTVDRSDPRSSLRLFADRPAAAGWWRAQPVVRLTGADGDARGENSGLASLRYRLGGGDWVDYTGPFTLPEGVSVVSHQATDNAGRWGPILRLVVPTDVTAPTARATTPNPSLWLRIGLLNFGPPKAQLGWEVTENLASSVRVWVVIHDLTGNVVRVLGGDTHPVVPGQKLTGATAWDGKDQTLTGVVPVGLYYYRVAAVDQAGNWTHSGESKPIQIKLAL